MLTLPDTFPQDAAGAADHHGAGGPGDIGPDRLGNPEWVQVAILGELRALNGKLDTVSALVFDGLAAAEQFRPVAESIIAAIAAHPLLSRFIRL